MLLSVENMIVRKRVGDRGAVDMFKEAGFTGIDYSFCMMEDWEETVNGENALAGAEDLRKYAEERGMAFTQSHAPFKFKYGMEMNENEYEYFRIVKSMEYAAAMKIPMMVVHAVLPNDGQDVMEYNYRFYSSLLPYAEKYGIKIGVENLTGRRWPDPKPTQDALGNPEKFCAMQDRLNSPYICGCFDIGHANLTTKDAPGFIRQCKGYIHYIHTHDNDGKNDNHELPALARWFDEKAKPDTKSRDFLNPNQDYSIPWNKVLAALKDIGFDGPFNMELLRYMDCFTTEDLPAALSLAAAVGRRMMRELMQHKISSDQAV